MSKAHPDFVAKESADQLAERIIRDIRVGVGDTGIKAGIIGEIGTSDIMTDDERKVLCAAGIAGFETKKAIHVHTGLYSENGFEIIDILTSHGVAPEKICIDHIDVWLRPNYVKELLKRGVYVEFDNFGKEFYVNKERRFAYDLERVQLLKELIDEGWADKVLISNDICLKTMWKTFGGLGYAHILRDVRAMAIESGIDEKIYDAILTDNVVHFIK